MTEIQKNISGLESHSVQTEDGYILTLLRLPGSSDRDNHSCKRHPVLIVHGLICAGTHWCLNTTNKNLPYKLQNEGYEVWLANLRGTPLSRSNVNINADSSEFWDFSWHEMSLYDVPSMINYILNISGSDKLSYIGHSMGAAIFFAAMALSPEYNSKVDVMIALAPSVYGKHVRNKLAKLSVPVGTFLGRLKMIYSREIFPMTLIAYAKKFLLPFLSSVDPERVGSWVLRTFGKRVGVLGSQQIEKSRMISIAGELPSPTSLKVFCHGTQCFSSDRFQQYDYGKIGNYKKYGQPYPPKYDLRKTTVRVATFYSHGDQLCTMNDVNTLAKQLPNLIENVGIHHPQFAHTDFMFGKDADKLVYDKILQIFNSYCTTRSNSSLVSN